MELSSHWPQVLPNQPLSEYGLRWSQSFFSSPRSPKINFCCGRPKLERDWLLKIVVVPKCASSIFKGQISRVAFKFFVLHLV